MDDLAVADPNILGARIAPDVRRVARVAGNRYNVDPDDLYQEIMLAMLYGTAARNYRPEEGGLLGYLAGVARHIALNMRRTAHAGLELPISQMQVQDDDLNPLDLLGATEIPDPDILIGIAKIESSILDGCRPRQSKPAGPRPRKKQREPNEAHRRFREIRRSLGLTKSAYAEKLHITRSSVDAYEYGKTTTVPEHILRAAEDLARNANLAAEAVEPIDRAVARWAGALNIDLGDTPALAKALQTTSTTIRRWKARQATPSMARLGDIERLVAALSGETKKHELKTVLTVLRKTSASNGENTILDASLLRRFITGAADRPEFSDACARAKHLERVGYGNFVVAPKGEVQEFFISCFALTSLGVDH